MTGQSTEIVLASDGAVMPSVIPDRHHDRSKVIGGSDVAAVLGLSDYRTPLDVYRLKIGEAPELSAADRLWLERRKRWEPVVLQHMREELDADIVRANVRYRDPFIEFMCAEIDAEAYAFHAGSPARERDELVNIEVKTVDPRAFGARKSQWGEPGSDEIPIEYECQVQWGLGVTGRRRAIVAAMVGLDEMLFYNVARNETVIAAMRDRVAAFWRDHVIARVPPEPKTLGDVAWLYPKHDGDTLIVAGELQEKALRLRTVVAKLDAYEAERDELEFALKRYMGPAETLLLEGGDKVATWRTQQWSMLDFAMLKAREPKTYKAFTIKGTRRVFRVLKGER